MGRMTATAPEHGQERGYRQVERVTGTGKFLVPGHRGVVEVELVTSAESHPECERWCSNCQAWQPQAGIVAALIGCRSCGASWDDAEDRSGMCAQPHPEDRFATCTEVCGHTTPHRTSDGSQWCVVAQDTLPVGFDIVRCADCVGMGLCERCRERLAHARMRTARRNRRRVRRARRSGRMT